MPASRRSRDSYQLQCDVVAGPAAELIQFVVHRPDSERCFGTWPPAGCWPWIPAGDPFRRDVPRLHDTTNPSTRGSSIHLCVDAIVGSAPPGRSSDARCVGETVR